MKHIVRTIVFFTLLQSSFSVHSSKASLDISTLPPTTPHPETTKLEQLKKMEESSLMGWYDMVNKFLEIIKPDQRTLEDVINVAAGKHELDPQEFVVKMAKMNYAFLSMVIIGLIYVIVMLITGVFFFCCRICGRCGAKDSQKQRRSDNCWRTIHKFCLILMVAFLVVPITCMCIINVHMSHSSPNIKGNITEVFDILGSFANKTDEDIENAIEQHKSPIQNFDAFKNSFVELVQENISSSIDHDKLEEIKNIVAWIAAVEEKHAAMSNASDLYKAVQHLKLSISDIRKEVKSLHNCTNSDKKICQLDFKPLPLERINVNDTYAHVHNEFQKLLKINFEELTSVIDQIQNNTILRNKIEEESESLKRFSDEAMSGDSKEGLEKIKNQVKYYTDTVRNITESGKREVKRIFAETDGYEIYRYWTMFGIAAVLLCPVIFLTLGLICGCSGYEKERHPTKRSSTSNCGGLCLILAVYYFFLVSSALMVVTIALFIFGGNMQTFVCIPLYEKEFKTLDEMKDKLSTFHNSSVLNYVKPSKLLNDCHDDKSIIYALGLINESDPQSIEKFIKNSNVMDSNTNNEIDEKLRNAILEITSSIRERLRQFKDALNLQDLKDIPAKLQKLLTTSRTNMSSFIENVTAALNEDISKEVVDNLYLVNVSATGLYEEMDELQEKLNGFSSTLLKIYNEADNYKAKIRDIGRSLNDVEEKLPKVIKAHLFYAVASSSGWTEMVENIGKCFPVWIAFNIARIAVCDFVINPINGFWFGLGWALFIIIPTILFSVKLSRFYLRMKYDDDSYIPDLGEAIPLEDMSRAKPFSYTNPGAMSWMPQFSPHQNYMVHPTSNNQARHFHYK